MKTEKLAIDGGKPVRQKPLPSRRIFGKSELEMLNMSSKIVGNLE